jgi:hypothetical protein
VEDFLLVWLGRCAVSLVLLCAAPEKKIVKCALTDRRVVPLKALPTLLLLILGV